MIQSLGEFIEGEDIYEVTITRKRRRRAATRVWLKLRDQPAPGEEDYGYVDSGEIIDVEQTLYEQRVDSLDLLEVVKAVNGVK